MQPRVRTVSVLSIRVILTLILLAVPVLSARQAPGQTSRLPDGHTDVLWIGEKSAVKGLHSEDGSIAVFPEDHLEDLAADPGRGVVWAGTSRDVARYAVDGTLLLRFDLPDADGERGRQEHIRRTGGRQDDDEEEKDDEDKGDDRSGTEVRTHLSLDPSDGSVWAGRRSEVYRLSATGEVMRRITLKASVRDLAVDISDGSCWVGTKHAVHHYAQDGRLLSSLAIEKGNRLHALAPETVSGTVWVGTAKGFLVYDRAGNEQFRTDGPFHIRDLRAEHAGGAIWAITKKEVRRYGLTGEVLLSKQLCPDSGRREEEERDERSAGCTEEDHEGDGGSEDDGDDHGEGACEGNLVALAVDPATGVCFAAWRKGVQAIAADGAILNRYGGFKQIEALDTGLPPLAVTILAPETGAVLEDRQATVAGTVSDPSAAVTVNGREAVVTGSAFGLPDLPLITGENRITASATDRARRTASDTVTVTVRSVLPPLEVVIETPAQGDVTMNARITARGRVSDPSATVVVNGIRAEVSGAVFTASGIPVSPGENLITAYAADPSGRSAEDSVSVTHPWIDISITSPFNGDLYISDSTDVYVTANDPATEVAVNGQLSDEYEDGEWVFRDIGLLEGWNEITARAVNQWGQVDQETVHVRYQLPDTGPVTLEVLTPEDGATLETPTIIVAGTVSDPDAEVIVNDVPAELENGLFRAVIPACDETEIVPDAEWCLITVRVFADDGSTDAAWITYYYDPVEDPLRTAIVDPGPGSAVFASPATVTVAVEDALGSITPTVVTVNGVAARQTAGNSFAADIPLDDGKNTVTVRAENLLGHVAYDAASIIYEPPTRPLSIQITAPVEGAIINTPDVSVSGLMSDSTAQVTVNDRAATTDFRSFRAGGVALAPGGNVITATTLRRSGEEAAAEVRVIYDPAYPSPPAPQLAELPGSIRSPYLEVPGLAQPLQVVEVLVDGAVQASAVADGQGLFTASVQLANEGPHNIAARAVDGFGNRSSHSAEKTVLRDILPPGLGNVALYIDSLNLRVSRVFVQGGTEPNAGIEIAVDGEPDAAWRGKADERGGFSQLIPMSAGRHSISIHASDPAGNHSTYARTHTVAVPDHSIQIPPVIDPLPTPVNESSLDIEGNAYARFTIEVYRNDELMGTVISDADGRFRLEQVPLVPGTNRFTVRQLADQISKGPSYYFVKEALSPAVVVEQLSGPAVRPQIVIDFPKDGSVTTAPAIPVRGTVGNGGTSVRLPGGWTCSESYGPVEDGRFRSYGVIPLLPGWNTVWVETTAPDGSRGVDKVRVRYQPDAEVPSAAILSPADRAEVYDRTVPVRGTAAPQTVRLVVNETETAPAAGEFSSAIDIFSPYMYRPESGNSVIAAWAMDEAGRIGYAESRAWYKYVPVPAITVASPGNGVVLETPEATITGTVMNASEVLVNGRTALLSGPTFTHEVSLVYGRNDFNIVAKNGPKAAGMTMTLYYLPGQSSLQSISVYPQSVELAVGKSVQLTATAVYTSGLTAEVTATAAWTVTTHGWNSGDPVATAENGYVKALRSGSATITVSYGGVSADVPVTVGLAALESMKLMYEKVSGWQTFYAFDDPRLALGQATRFLSMGTYPDGTKQDLTPLTTWKSSDPRVVYIDLWGNAEARAPGTAIITGTLNDLSATMTAVVDPPAAYLFITSPAEGASVDTTEVTVSGTVMTGASEVGVTVNGVQAAVTGDRFAANHVPLGADGVITATATDTNGATMTAKTSVRTFASGNPLRIAANIDSGTGPLEAVLRVDGTIDETMPDIIYLGPGNVEFLDCTKAESCKVRLTTPGVYTFTVTAPDYDGNSYSAKIAITVLDKAKLDALLQAKWEGMKAALARGDIEGAAAFFSKYTQPKYKEIFRSIGAKLPTLVTNMKPIQMIYLHNDAAKYRIRKEELYSGQMMLITYYIYFVRGDNGYWMIEKF